MVPPTIVLVLFGLYSGSSDQQVQGKLKDWRECLLQDLRSEQKICLSNKVSDTDKNIQSNCLESMNRRIVNVSKTLDKEKYYKQFHFNQFEKTFLLVEEEEDLEEVVLYSSSGKRQAWWTWIRDIEDVSTFQDRYSEIILVEYDNSTFAYRHILNTSDYQVCTITKLENINNFLFPTCTNNTSQTISIKQDLDSPPWYRYARIAFQDNRIARLNKDKRKPTEQKWLTLPYFKKHIMNEGES